MLKKNPSSNTNKNAKTWKKQCYYSQDAQSELLQWSHFKGQKEKHSYVIIRAATGIGLMWITDESGTHAVKIKRDDDVYEKLKKVEEYKTQGYKLIEVDKGHFIMQK